MTRPLGSKNKPKETIGNFSSTATMPNVTVQPEVHYDLCIAVRAHRKGIWAGKNLWELVTLNNGIRKVVIDATDRRSIINMVVKYIGKIVVADAPL